MKKRLARRWQAFNAALQVKGQPSLILDRTEAYTAILIDDLISKGNEQPYRMLSRAPSSGCIWHRQCRSPTYATRPPRGIDFECSMGRFPK